jgi:3-deoxy-7-phosphoheptulonate synthase
MTQSHDGNQVNVNIASFSTLPTPGDIKSKLPRPSGAQTTVAAGRKGVEAILDGKDPRLLMVVGPCSIHDLKAGYEYAQRLKELGDKVADRMLVLMRVYFVKPRTTVGWKGFINDPYLDDSFRIDEGIYKAREFLIQIGELGLPAGTEALDAIIPQYIDDLISWTAIGARTTESQLHREMASGLSSAVGFKNATDGSIDVAVNALMSVSQAHHFLGVDQEGRCAVFHTCGNSYGHIVLRGGTRPNYDTVSVALCEAALRDAGLAENLMIDCSHGNSSKDHRLQSLVLKDCVTQIIQGNKSIKGFMLESNLNEGTQKIPADLSQLKYGVSVTDACMSWEDTEIAVLDAYKRLAAM